MTEIKGIKGIGIVRVSDSDGREGDSFISPQDQADRLREYAEREGIDLIAIHQEMDVSGRNPLSKRAGLRAAIESVERGEATVILGAYFDRLVRSLKTQAALIERTEAAGGRVIALDFGRLTEGTAAEWLSSTMVGAVAEYYSRSIGDRVGHAHVKAVNRGVVPFPRIPLGLRRRKDGTLEPNPDTAADARTAFLMRSEQRSWRDIQMFLADRGHKLTIGGIRAMLSNRIYLGELHFGKLHNLESHDAIIPVDLFDRVQETRSQRGPVPKSDLLLSRLRVLECESCGGAMGPAQWRDARGLLHKRYRCIASGKGHASIDAEAVDPLVIDAAWRAAADRKGIASANHDYRQAAAALDAAQRDLDATIEAFQAAGLGAEPGAIKKLAGLRERRDELKADLEKLTPASNSVAFPAPELRDHAKRDDHRDVIQLVIDRVVIAPAVRGSGIPASKRVSVIPRW